MKVTRLLFVGIVVAALPGLVLGGTDLAIRGGLARFSVEGSGETSLTLGASGSFDVVPMVAVGGEVDWWRYSQSASAFGYTAEASISDIALSAVAKVKPPTQGFIVAAGAGLGMHMFTATASYGGYSMSASENEFGIHLLGEAGVPVGPMAALIAQLKYGLVSLEGVSLNLLYMTAGVQFNLGGGGGL